MRREQGSLDLVYETRFDERARRGKMAVWAEIVRFLERYVVGGLPVLDIGCDAGYFIANLDAPDRWATDIREVGDLLPNEIRFVKADGLRLTESLPPGSFGTIFMSNYLEHLASSHAVIEQLRVVSELLAPGGRVIVLQPNIKLTGGQYWDFIDHHVPLTERSLVEAGELAGLRTIQLTTRFLPFTTKGRLPQHRALVRLYLAMPLMWRILGKQTLYVGERPD